MWKEFQSKPTVAKFEFSVITTFSCRNKRKPQKSDLDIEGGNYRRNDHKNKVILVLS
jgi:hypothetical protein